MGRDVMGRRGDGEGRGNGGREGREGAEEERGNVGEGGEELGREDEVLRSKEMKRTYEAVPGEERKCWR